MVEMQRQPDPARLLDQGFDALAKRHPTRANFPRIEVGLGRVDGRNPQRGEGNALEEAVQPRMNTNGHGYQGLAEDRRITRRVPELPGAKSVVVRG